MEFTEKEKKAIKIFNSSKTTPKSSQRFVICCAIFTALSQLYTLRATLEHSLSGFFLFGILIIILSLVIGLSIGYSWCLKHFEKLLDHLLAEHEDTES